MPTQNGYGYRSQQSRRYSPIRPRARSRTFEVQDQEKPNQDPQMAMRGIGTIAKGTSDYMARKELARKTLEMNAKKQALKAGADTAGKEGITSTTNAGVTSSTVKPGVNSGTTIAKPAVIGATGAGGATTSVGASMAGGAQSVAAADAAGAATEASMSGGAAGGISTTQAAGGYAVLGNVGAGAMAGYAGGQVGEGIATYYGANKDQSRAVGAVGAAGAGYAAGGLYGAAGGLVAYGAGEVAEENDWRSWLCSATLAHAGLNEKEIGHLATLRKHTIKKYKKIFKFYLQTGPELMTIINSTEKDITGFFKRFKTQVISKVIDFIKNDEAEKAFELYDAKTRELYKKYLPSQELP